MSHLARAASVSAVWCLASACSSATDRAPRADGSVLEAGAGNAIPEGGVAGVEAAGAAGSTDTSLFAGTTELDVPVPDVGRVYVELSGPGVVEPGTPEDSNDWDLAFEGFNVYTNSGPSGTGKGAAFGRLDIFTLESDTAPKVPFLSPDKAGGAFVDWYAYDGTSHALYSRYHVYGVKSGDRLWKIQILSYYSEQDSAPVSALYQIRYAELGAEIGETQNFQIDGSAGGLAGTADAPSGCLELATGAAVKLTAAQARTSRNWDLCFRRDSISVNGEAGGPRGVAAVDLQSDDTSEEMLPDVEKETADSALPSFAKVSASSFSNAPFRGDHVVSAFETGTWLDMKISPLSPAFAAWLVLDAAGQREFLMAFGSFRNATTSSPGTVVLNIKPVKQ